MIKMLVSWKALKKKKKKGSKQNYICITKFIGKNIRLLCMYLYNPCAMSKMWHKVNFEESKTGLISEFSFS